MVSEAEWISAFYSPDGTFREGVEFDLAQSMRRGETAVRVVLALLEHPDERMRGSVAWALQELGDRCERFLPAIYRALTDSSSDVRYWSVGGLQLVRDEQKTEAIVHLLPLLRDKAYWVRIAACELIHSLGRRHFEKAMDDDPSRFGMDADQVRTVAEVQAVLREGYARFAQSGATTQAVEALGSLAQLGYAMALGYQLLEDAELMSEGVKSLSPDARQFLVAQAASLIRHGIEAIRPLALDPELRLRRGNWLALNSIALDVARWQRYLPEAARDPDPKVREACFLHLHHRMPYQAVDAVITSVGAGQQQANNEALEALRNLAETASCIAAVNEQTLRDLVRTLDDPALSGLVREDILHTLQAYAKIFTRAPASGIDWRALLARESML